MSDAVGSLWSKRPTTPGVGPLPSHHPRGGSPPSPPPRVGPLPPHHSCPAFCLLMGPKMLWLQSQLCKPKAAEGRAVMAGGVDVCCPRAHVSLGVGSSFSEHLLRGVPRPKPSAVTVMLQSSAGAWRQSIRAFVMLLCVSERTLKEFMLVSYKEKNPLLFLCPQQ